jgi:hypothetical protein
VDGIRPGEYRLKVRINSGLAGTEARMIDEDSRHEDVLSSQREFTVPTVEPGQPFPKIDLGEIIVEPVIKQKL